MNNSDLHNDKCLSLHVMRLYHERQLGDREMHHVEKHLLDCDLCSDVFEGLDVKDIPVINSITANVNRKVLSLSGAGPVAQPSFLDRFKWYFIVPAALIIAWLAWNRAASGPGVTETPPVANDQPVPQITPAPLKSDPAADAPVAVREPQGVEKSVPAPVAAPSEKEKPLVKQDEPVVSSDPPKDPEVKEPESKDAGTPIVADDKPGNKTAAPPTTVDHAPLKMVEVKVISKVTAAVGSRKKGKAGEIGGSRVGGVDDGMQPNEMPVFYGGDEAMKTWLIRSFQNPVENKSELKGRTTAVIFDVSSKGKIDNIEITRSLSKELDAEVVRLIESMPQWKAAAKKGTITVVLAITFK